MPDEKFKKIENLLHDIGFKYRSKYNKKIDKFNYWVMRGLVTLKKNINLDNVLSDNHGTCYVNEKRAKERNSLIKNLNKIIMNNDILEGYKIVDDYYKDVFDSNPIVGYQKQDKKYLITDVWNYYTQVQLDKLIKGNFITKHSSPPFFKFAYLNPYFPVVNACLLFKKKSVIDYFVDKIKDGEIEELYKDFFFNEPSINYIFENNFEMLFTELSYIKENIEGGYYNKALKKIDSIIEYIDDSKDNSYYLLFDFNNLPPKTEVDMIFRKIKEFKGLGDPYRKKIDFLAKGLYIHLLKLDNISKKEIRKKVSKKFDLYDNKEVEQSPYIAYSEKQYDDDNHKFRKLFGLI